MTLPTLHLHCTPRPRPPSQHWPPSPSHHHLSPVTKSPPASLPAPNPTASCLLPTQEPERSCKPCPRLAPSLAPRHQWLLTGRRRAATPSTHMLRGSLELACCPLPGSHSSPRLTSLPPSSPPLPCTPSLQGSPCVAALPAAPTAHSLTSVIHSQVTPSAKPPLTAC